MYMYFVAEILESHDPSRTSAEAAEVLRRAGRPYDLDISRRLSTTKISSCFCWICLDPCFTQKVTYNNRMFHRISQNIRIKELMFYRILAFFVHLHAIECQVRQLFEHPKLSHSPSMAYPIIRFKLVGVLPMGQSPVLISTSVRPRSGFRGFGRCLRCLNHRSPRGFPEFEP
jgi:hypothetical protein